MHSRKTCGGEDEGPVLCVVVVVALQILLSPRQADADRVVLLGALTRRCAREWIPEIGLNVDSIKFET